MTTWLTDLDSSNPVAHAVLVLSLVCVGGMTLGHFKFRGIGLGTSGVLFAGILVGHFGKPINHETLDFVKEFGLILFIFTMGLQLGPGFFAGLRAQGLRLNALAAAIVVSGAALTAAAGWLFGVDHAAMLGVFSGATTNTPSLGAATQTLMTLPDVSADRLALPALAYAVTYPMAILGIIGSLLLLRHFFRIDAVEEAAKFKAAQPRTIDPLERRTMVVENANLRGVTIDSIPGRANGQVIVSRIRRADETDAHAATGETVVQPGDVLLVVGTRQALDHFQLSVGSASATNLMEAPGPVGYRRVVVTDPGVLGKTVQQLGLDHLYGVAVTRITRADLEMTAVPNLRLQFGDLLQIVSDEAGLEKATAVLGNSTKELSATHFIPLFIGIALGIALGTLPIAVPGLPQPVRLGLAGGPLIVAILLSRMGRLGRVVFRMPVNSNLAFREFGIALFFASVGLSAGAKFFSAVFSSSGLAWLLTGIAVTVVPLIAVGIFARRVWKMDFLTLSGLLAGSMTDPPALAFANNLSHSEAPTIAYAAVFPLTTLLRILAAQLLALALCG
jgi:putative transport protein